MEDSGSKELLVIEPNELRFAFEIGKRISCSLQLANRTDEYIAFKVKVTVPAKYSVLPNSGVVPPQSNCDVIVTMQAQQEAPLDMQCKDKFLVESVVVRKGATREDVTSEMFKNDSGNIVEQVMVKVVYIQPTPSSRTSVSKLDWHMVGCDYKELVLQGIEPYELCFSFEVMKQSSCSFQLRNRTDECIAFKVKVTNPKDYCVWPNVSIVPPRSSCDVIVTKQALTEAPPNMLCKDKFLVQSVVVMEGTTIKDITLETFKKEGGNVVDEVKISVVYEKSLGPPLHVGEGFEEGSPCPPSWSDGGSQDDLRAHKELEEITSEVSPF